jgi:hypothetical protein
LPGLPATGGGGGAQYSPITGTNNTPSGSVPNRGGSGIVIIRYAI